MKRSEVIGLINLALEDGNVPVVHPNGFIQLKLSDGRRMHFWHEEIPRQKTASRIHDHIFDMHSEIVAGTIMHEEIRIHNEENGYYNIYQAEPVRDTETRLVKVHGVRVRADHCHPVKMIAGDTYDFPAFSFHETRDTLGPAISIITKEREYQEFKPRVLVPHGEEPDNDFVRDGIPIGTVIGHMSWITDHLLPGPNSQRMSV